MPKKITHQYFFPHPPSSVWEYLTRADLMELWLMKNDFQPILGHEFQFKINPVPALDFDGIVHCRVLEILPFKKLSYSWKTGPGDGTTTIDSVVVWTLEPKDKGTELLLEHTGFSETANLAMFNALNGGWLTNIKKIAERLNTAQHGTTNP
jgi:uncharacterized protein YndB with AHSA1/START domain